jgi:hypothetical protein
MKEMNTNIFKFRVDNFQIKRLSLSISVFIVFTSVLFGQTMRKIAQEDLRDKISGYWIEIGRAHV